MRPGCRSARASPLALPARRGCGPSRRPRGRRRSARPGRMARSPGAIAPCGRSSRPSHPRGSGASRPGRGRAPGSRRPADRCSSASASGRSCSTSPLTECTRNSGAARRSGPQEDGGGHAQLGRAVDHGGQVRRRLGAHERGQRQIHPHVIVDRLEEAHRGERASAHVEEVVVRPRAEQRRARPPRWRGAAPRWTAAGHARALRPAHASAPRRWPPPARISSRQPGLASDSRVARRQAVHHVPSRRARSACRCGSTGSSRDLDDQLRHVRRRGVPRRSRA